MSLFITAVIDFLTAGLFVYRMGTTNQVVFLASTVVQLLFFIDLLGVVFLRPKHKKEEHVPVYALETPSGRKERRRQEAPKKHGDFSLFINVSCLISFGLAAYYVVSSLLLFI